MLPRLCDLLDQTKLDEKQVTQIYKILLREPIASTSEYLVDHGHILIIEVFDLLSQSLKLTNEQILGLLAEYGDVIRGYGEDLGAAVLTLDESADIPTPVLIGLADSQYVTVTGKDTYYDLSTGMTLDQLPQMPLSMLTLNLATLYLRHHHSWRTRMEAGEEGDAGNRTADNIC